MEKNLAALRECEALSLPMMVMVCGATPGQTPEENVAQIRDGLGTLAPAARDAGVRLAVEPLHPMYAADRSAIASMKAANDVCEAVADPQVGVALDVFHVWWDLDLEAETRRCADAGRLFAYHICDWKQSMDDMLLDRGIPGEGVIPLKKIDTMVRATGFDGLAEVEVFSRHWWSQNQHHSLAAILDACKSIY
jgi:sugar phosphate isomerase/epimerase